MGKKKEKKVDVKSPYFGLCSGRNFIPFSLKPSLFSPPLRSSVKVGVIYLNSRTTWDRGMEVEGDDKGPKEG